MSASPAGSPEEEEEEGEVVAAAAEAEAAVTPPPGEKVLNAKDDTGKNKWAKHLGRLKKKRDAGGLMSVAERRKRDKARKERAAARKGQLKQTTTAQSTQVANSVDRTRLWAAVTPQFFPLSALIAALTAAKVTENTVTDEASAMEIAGCAPYLVESSRQNIKITHAEDLALAQYYLTIQGIIAP